MLELLRLRSHQALPLLCAAALLTGCGTSVDLKRYTPPPILTPEQQLPPAESAPPSLPAEAQPRPIEPARTEAETLPPADPVNSEAHLVTFSADMDASQATPPGHSSAWGHIDLLYDSSTHLLRWRAAWSGLSSEITGVRFHGPASPGESAAAVMIWPGPFDARYEGRATLTPAQAADLLAGHWYVNVLTRTQPLGEIRGQLAVVQ